MRPAQIYETARALRTALETRLGERARALGTPVQRLRYFVVFDRFLARLAESGQVGWMLKGGYAMELRMTGARTTKDIDLSIRRFDASATNQDLAISLREALQEVAAIDLDDYFTFTIGVATDDVENAVYGGVRFPVTAHLDGRLFQPFRIDVVVGDPPIDDAEELIGGDWLAFAGIAPAKILAIRAEQQYAEKLHAYTFPRSGTPNSRVKDLVDMLLLTKHGKLTPARLANAISRTFQRRDTHRVPGTLPPPPKDWPTPYRNSAAECGLTESLEEAYSTVKEFLQPTLTALSARVSPMMTD